METKEIVYELDFLISLAKTCNGVLIRKEDGPTQIEAYYETWVENHAR
jgi:hypothetical protein